jgi:copper(I)-binding protein
LPVLLEPTPLFFALVSRCAPLVFSSSFETTMNSFASRPPSAGARLLRHTVAAMGLALLAQSALAQAVVVKDAWARATVPGQQATGVFMSLSSPAGARLKSVSTPVAGIAEVHEMRMEGDVMKMSALKDGLELPPGKTVELKPGSYHLMLMDLKVPLKRDSTIPLTLVLVDSKGVESKTELKVPVGTAAPMPGAHAMPPSK